MCQTLQVSRSGFYKWQTRRPSRRAVETRQLDLQIQQVYQEHQGRVGSPKVTIELKDSGIACSRPRVARRMQQMGLKARTHRRFRVTTNSQHKYPVAANLLQREFIQSQRDSVWVSDITYIGTQEGWLYLSVFIDLYSRRVVGWSCSPALGHEMVVQALQRAVWQRQPPQGLMIHSDRGVQYACTGFREILKKYRFVQSMSRKGNCWDNAVAESFFKTLKTELVYLRTFITRAQAHREILEYIEGYYNRRRRHATLNYKTPVAFEQKQKAA